MKLFLTSKGLINKEIQKHFLAFVEGRKTISLITTASTEYKEKNRNNVKLKNLLTHLGFIVKFLDVEFDSPKELYQSEIIVINGGNPYYLLHQVRKSKTDIVLNELREKEIPIMGISSGLLILMKDLEIIDWLTPEMNTIKLKNKNGLGWIDEVVIPHYDRFINEGKIKKEIVDDFEKQSKSPVIRLGEYQGLKYLNNDKTMIG